MTSLTLTQGEGLPVEQHSLGKSVALHILPGALILLVFLAAASIAAAVDLPPIIASYVTVVVALVPFQIGHLLREGSKSNTRRSLGGVVLNRSRLRLREYLLLVPLLMGWAVVVFAILSPLNGWMKGEIFFWWPGWLDPTAPTKDVSMTFAIGLLLAGILIDGFAAPVVEEMYFRGYLLPRISYLGALAPLVNTVLFTLYHLSTLWLAPIRILALLPLVYTVWWRRNIYLSIVTHCSLNVLALLITFVTVAL